MTWKIYLDSNVFISFVREEMDSAFNLRYVDSGNFFALCGKEKYVLVLSDLFFIEVYSVISLSRKDIVEHFDKMQINVFITGKKPSEKLVSKIVEESGIHLADAIHAALAYENKADFIVTWNKRDFSKADSFVKCASPSELLYTL